MTTGARATASGAWITVQPLKKRWFLGENILVNYQVKNEGKKVLSVSHGGDYRGASRHLRFKVVAVDARGRKVADPDPSGYHLGGLGGTTKLARKKSYIQTIPLMRYCRFEKPGVYKVRVAHDLGWKGLTPRGAIPAGDRRWAEATIELVMPGPRAARSVVRKMAALPRDPNCSAGRAARPWADFSCLRYPVYLPILVQRATAPAGDPDALTGIANIPTPAATAALIRLLKHSNQAFVRQVISALSFRLPDPQLEGKMGPRHALINERVGQRRYLMRRSWRPRFEKDVRAAARRLLLSKSTFTVGSGAFMIQAVGTRADQAPLTRALTWAIRKTRTLPLETHVYPRPRGACAELLRAARVLLTRGALVPQKPRSPGEILFYLVAWGSKAPSERPRDFAKRAVRWLRHPIPYVREKTLTLTAHKLPGPMGARLRPLLRSRNVEVQIAACRAIRDSKIKRYQREILRLIAVARRRWLVYEVNHAAHAIGIPKDRLYAAWARRLDDPTMTKMAFDKLCWLIQHRGGSSMSGTPDAAEGRRLKRRWLRFIRDHRAAIRAGRRFRVGDPELTADLIPRGFSFNRPNKPPWPPGRP